MALDLAGKILDPIIDIGVRKVVHHVGYVFRYKKNINELKVKKEELEKKMEENEEKVEAANIRNDIVEKKVEEWKQKAEDKKREVENLTVDKARDENVKCLTFFCPNLCSRYHMSKKALQKKGDIDGLIQGGNFEVVAHNRSPPLELQFTSTGNFINFDSREPLLKLIKDKLKSGNPDNMIGVHGAGGIGKTATVEEVGRQLKKEGVFYEVVKGVVSRDVNVHEIQGQLAHQLRLDIVSKTEAERRDALWNRFNNGKNNLVMLDDLWEEIKLTDIGIPLRQGNKGCKVVLTTRDCKVLTKMEVSEHISVEVLSDEEAWALFEKKVGVTFDLAEFYNVAKSVCKECQGLPVAILAIGGALIHETDMRIWKDVLNQLQNSSWETIDGIDRKMYASLRWSYDYLGKTLTEATSILLLCCLYPEDYNIPVDFLLSHCIARRMLPNKSTVDNVRNRIINLVKSLKGRSLLLDGKDKDHVKMHDVIRDVVISIAKTDEQYLVKNVITDYWPVESINENMAAISVQLKELEEVPNELVCPRLHTLRIECKDSSFQFPDNFFSGVGEITVLELKGIRLSSTPSSLANLSKLRTLILIDCQLEDMSFLKGLKSNLEVLIIADSDTEALPMELGELSRLRVLLLNNCYRLKLIPAGVISKLTHLEELCLPDEFKFCEFSGSESEDIEISRATLSELSSLTQLTNLCVFIPNVTLVPDLNFSKLVSYRIALGEHFYKHEEHFKERNLKLNGITYHDKIVGLLERAEVLFFYRVKGLKNVLLNKGGERFLELEHFFIKDCDDLEQLLGTPYRYARNQGLNQSNSFSKLTTLEVSDCSFKFLFTSSHAKGLQQLKKLDISFCGILEEIVGTEGEKDEQDHFNFSKLKELRLWNLPKLISFGPKTKENTTVEGDSLPKGQSLFNEKVIFPVLEHLYIESLPNITKMWDKQVIPKESFPHLANVTVIDCMKLVTVFPSILWAHSLRWINVNDCEGVTVVVSITGLEESDDANNCSIIFPQLRYAKLENLENLNAFCGNSTGSKPQSLFDPQVIFPVLEELKIKRLPNITEIWDKQVLPTKSFLHLANVVVKDCMKLANVFPSNLWAQCLRNVNVDGCKGITVIVSITELEESEDANNCSIIFPQLSNVELNDLENLNAFCGNSNGSNPQSLFDPQVIFPVLEQLEIESLPNITKIWDKQVLPSKSFPQLATVSVSGCENLVTVFPSNLWAQSLRKVTVGYCKGVTVVVAFTGLEESEDADNCSIIFPQLREVWLFNLENLNAFCSNSSGSKPQSLINPRVIFPVLEQLEIESLPNIIEIWDKQVLPTKSFPHLADVKVSGCEKLVTVFPSILWAESLKKVSVRDCKGVTVVVLITGLEESEDANNCSIIFPQLRVVRLFNLENLNAFCSNSSGSKPQSLFDPQVIFPALEKLEIWCLPNITVIWDKQVIPTNSFPHLARVLVSMCDKLVTVFPSNLWAQSLRDLNVDGCKGVTVIVSITELEESEDANNCSIIFSQLIYVSLDNLENLNTFCGNSSGSKPQSLFDPRVIFPALEELKIKCLPNITEIWDKQVLPTKSFPHLADVVVKDCMKLVTVFPSNLWARCLKKVSVRDCKGVIVVVSITGLEESEGKNNCSIIFPQLSYVKLNNLENLNAFCSNSSGSKPQSLFDPQVIFPALEQLKIWCLPNITEIWDKQVLPSKSFPHLATVCISGCDKLVTVFPSIFWAQRLRKVTVGYCKGVIVVVSCTGLEKSADANNCSIIFPQLSNVELNDLENLNAFCGNSSKSKPQSLFDPRVHFPALESIALENLPNIEIFKQQLLSREKVKFPALRRWSVGDEERYTVFE